jgi:hypothetical protein
MLMSRFRISNTHCAGFQSSALAHRRVRTPLPKMAELLEDAV